MSKWLDAEGYPKKKALRALQELAERPDWSEAVGLDLLRAMWNQRYGTVSEELTAAEREVVYADSQGREHDRYLRLSTGGWSGNEQLYDEFRATFAGQWSWRLSAAGGLHIHVYPAEKAARE